MATLTKQYTFTADTDAVASQVNTNFDDIVSFINNQLVHLDGSKTMTGILTLPASDPVSSNQAARKAYVDAQVATKASTASVTSEASTRATEDTKRVKMVASGNAQAPLDTAAPDWTVTQALMQGGTLVGPTNAAGDITITFPQAFPTACLAVVVNLADIGAGPYYAVVHNSGLRTGVAVRILNASGVGVEETIRLNWLAVGW